MKHSLSNDLLTVTIDTLGAELQSIENRLTGHQYLWHGDKAFWGRRSPVLFPIVGSVWEGRYRMDGKEYQLGQHGFARDCEFTPVAVGDAEARYALEANDHTLAAYPRRFRLEVGYKLYEARLTVGWRVVNLDTRVMHFQIGAHPAFNYPDFNAADPVHGFFSFDRADGLRTELLAEKGCVGPDEAPVGLDSERMVPITANTFDIDTIVLANNQVGRTSLLDKERKPYLTVLFQAPVVGLWSPSPQAPFVCIEPWYGRCDRAGFEGDFAERDYVNALAPGDCFEASYTIIFDNI